MNNVDQRAVEMRFDNKQFEEGVQTSLKSLDNLKKGLDLKDSAKSLSNLEKAGQNFSLDGVARGVDAIASKFSALSVMGITALANITNSAVNAGKRIVRAFTIDPIKSGLQEYETQINAIQTILANTESKGTTLGQVNSALNELNHYADKTIYNFTEMTRNIGTFTAAGVDLKTSVSAIKGIANLAAVSGSNAQQASVAMYQLSQAMASGTVKLMDWNSVVNAGMGGQVFQDALKETARVHKINIDAMIKSEGSFRETLQKGWLTTSILTETLSKFTGDLSAAQLKSIGYTDDQIKKIIKLGQTANDAATKVKTISQLFDTLKEAAQSGWTQSWQLLIGDFGEAKETLTAVSNILGNIISESANARNSLLTGGLSSGWKQLLNEGINDGEGYIEEIKKVAKESGISVDKMMTDGKTFEDTLSTGWLTGDMMKKGLDNFQKKVAKMSAEQLKNAGYTQDQVIALSELNSKVQAGTINLNEYAKKMTMLSGRQNLIKALSNSFYALMNVLTPIKSAFREIFPAATGKQLYDLTTRIKDFTEKFKIGGETAKNIRRTFRGLFAVLDIGKQILTAAVGAAKKGLAVIFPASKSLLSLTGNIGDFLFNIDQFLKKSGFLTTAVKTLGGVFEFAGKLITGSFKSISDVAKGFKSIDLSAFTKIGDSIKNGFAPLAKLQAPLEKVLGFLKQVGAKIATVFAALKEKLASVFTGFNFDSLTKVLSSGLLASFIAIIVKFITSLGSFANSAKGISDSISDTLGAAQKALGSLQNQLKAKVLREIAIAIAILAGSLLVLSFIDGDKLAGSLAAMGAMFVELFGSMGIMEKTLKSKGFKGMDTIIRGMIELSVAILILSFAMKNLGSLDFGQLVSGMTAVSVLFALMLKAADKMSSANKKIIKGSTGLIVFAIAIKILSDSVVELSKLDVGGLTKGIIGVGALIAAVSVFLSKTKFGAFGVKQAAGLMIFAIGIGLLALSVKILAGIDFPQLLQGLLGITVILGELLLFAKFLNNAELAKGAGMLISVGAALLIMAIALKIIGSLSPDALAQSLLAMSSMLVMLVGAIRLMPKNIGAIGLGLLGVSTALVIMAGAMALMGSMSLEQLAKGLGALAISLGILVVALRFMQGSLAGAFALLVIAGALAVLTPQLMLLSSISWGGLVKGLIMLGGALAIIAVASVVLSTIAAQVAIAGGVLIIMGVGLAALGAGILVLGIGLGALGAAGFTGILVLLALGAALIPLTVMIPSMLLVGAALLVLSVGVLALGAGFLVMGVGLTLINAALPTGIAQLVAFAKQGATLAAVALPLAAAGAALIVFGAGALVAGAGAVSAGIGMLMMGIGLKALNESGGVTALDGIEEMAAGLIKTGGALLLASPGLLAGGAGLGAFGLGASAAAKGMNELDSAALVFTVSFKTVSSGVKSSCNEILNSVNQMISALTSSIQNGQSKIVGIVTKTMSSCTSSITGARNGFVSSGAYLVDGFILGINSHANLAAKASAAMARAALNAANRELEVGSPSKKFAEVGKWADLGLAKGLSDYADKAAVAASMVGENTIRPVLTMTNGMLSNNGAVNKALKSMADTSSFSPPTVKSEKTTIIKHEFEPLTVKGVNNRGEFVASADYAVEEMLTSLMRRQNRT